MEKGEHPGIDASQCLDQNGIQKHQYLIRVIQCDISLDRLDINTTVMTLASFRAESREGNLDRAKKVVFYLVKFKHATIIITTEEPELSFIFVTPYDWEDSAYGKFLSFLRKMQLNQKESTW